MKVRLYDIVADAFVWRTMTREQLIGETAIVALMKLQGQIAWSCPKGMKPKPSVYVRRAMRDGLTDAEVWEVQSAWSNPQLELSADDDRPLNPAEDEGDAVVASRFLVTPQRAEIEAALEAVARDLPWMKEAA